jgi:hypothetical protein
VPPQSKITASSPTHQSEARLTDLSNASCPLCCCFAWAADMIAKVHDLTDPIGGYIGKYGLKREPISVRIANGSKPH